MNETMKPVNKNAILVDYLKFAATLSDSVTHEGLVSCVVSKHPNKSISKITDICQEAKAIAKMINHKPLRNNR